MPDAPRVSRPGLSRPALARAVPAARSPRRGRRGAAGVVAVAIGLGVASTAGAPGVVRVSPGDTLSGLAHRFSTTVSALRAANGLSGDTIYAGSTLRLPGSGGASSGRTHVVRAGETVSAIAARYGASTGSVLRANDLAASELIQPGQRLLVPGGTSPASTSSSAAPGVASAAAGSRATLARRSVPSRDAVRRMVADTARRYGVDPSLAVSVAYHESGFQQRVVSPVDAIGVMQVLPSTGRALSAQTGRSLDLYDASDNITAGVLLLRQLRQGTGSDERALAGYYQGLGSIAEQGVLPQTEQYLRNIAALRARFRTG